MCAHGSLNQSVGRQYIQQQMIKTSFAATALMLAIPAFAQNSAWNYSTKTNDMDASVTEFAMTDQVAGEDTSDSVIIRCKSTCEAYVHIGKGIIGEQETIRVKFNNAPPKRYAVTRGDGYDSLFFSSPFAIVKAIRDNGGYMTIEYFPYEKTPVTVRFGVWNLPPTILARLSKWEKKEQAAARAAAGAKSPSTEDAHSLLTPESCKSHGFVWHKESENQTGGCWSK